MTRIFLLLLSFTTMGFSFNPNDCETNIHLTHQLPIYNVSLDLPPEERWSHVVIPHKANIEKLIDTVENQLPIIIKNIQSSCGCTVPERPKKPIMPGEKGEIKVSYDTKRIGGFSKVITIFSNAKNPRKQLKIKGYVAKGISLEKEKSMLSEN